MGHIARSVRLSVGFLILFCLAALPALAQQIQVVSVTATGFGKTESEALTDAVVNGIAQVNGEAVASTFRMTSTATSKASGDAGSSEMSRNIEESISRKTKGVVQSWRKISAELAPSGDYSATASVNVYVLKRSAQLKRIKLAVVPARAGDQRYSLLLTEELVRNLTTSRKFALMDRKNNAEVEAQLGRIRKGGSIEDSVRLSAEVAPDFIAVVATTVTNRPDGRATVFGSLEIIDYSTRQVKLSEKKSMPLKAGDDTSNTRRLASLAKGLSRAVIQTVFPPTVIGADDGHITIGQGSDFFAVGDKLVVKRMGATLRDPHTGEYLSQDHTDVGSAVVTYVDSRIARAKLAGTVTLDAKGLSSKTFQVARSGESAGDFFTGLGVFSDVSTSSEGGKAKTTKKLFATGGNDDDD